MSVPFIFADFDILKIENLHPVRLSGPFITSSANNPPLLVGH